MHNILAHHLVVGVVVDDALALRHRLVHGEAGGERRWRAAALIGGLRCDGSGGGDSGGWGSVAGHELHISALVEGGAVTLGILQRVVAHVAGAQHACIARHVGDVDGTREVGLCQLTATVGL